MRCFINIPTLSSTIDLSIHPPEYPFVCLSIHYPTYPPSRAPSAPQCLLWTNVLSSEDTPLEQDLPSGLREVLV